MRKSLHPNRRRKTGHALMALALGVCVAAAWAQDDVSELLNSARPATAPAPLTSPDAPENQPVPTTAPTARAPKDSRPATLTLNDGTVLKGPIWTTTATPFRLWIAKDQVYKDVELAVVKSIDVHVISETMEDDWRWLKEGSDQKVYSGKKYPSVVLEYRFTLINDQVIEGSVLAPIYVTDPTGRTRTLALYKKYKGALDQTLKDLLYIRGIVLEPPGASLPGAPAAGRTTRLPLLPE